MYTVRAESPGILVECVEEGEELTHGDSVARIYMMKTYVEMKLPYKHGKVLKVYKKKGEFLKPNDKIALLVCEGELEEKKDERYNPRNYAHKEYKRKVKKMKTNLWKLIGLLTNLR